MHAYARFVCFAATASLSCASLATAQCPVSETIKLPSPAAEVEDNFGRSVVIHGNLLIVGAPGDDTAGENVGAAYIFERQEDDWIQIQQLTPDNPVADHRFGIRLAFDPNAPNTLVVTSQTGSAVDSAQGAAYVFELEGEGDWVQTAKLEGLAGATGYGWGVDIDDGVIMVGAIFEPNLDLFGDPTGGVYVYEQDPKGAWTETQHIYPSVGLDGGLFGAAIEVEDDRALIGMPYLGLDHIPGRTLSFIRSDGSWSEDQVFFGVLLTGRDRFGSAIEIIGEYAVIGSPRTPPPPNGIVNTFKLEPRADEPWQGQDFFLGWAPTYNDQFGGALSYSDGRLLVGAAGDEEGTGAASLFDFIDGELSILTKLLASDGETFDLFGISVSMDGDLIAIGAELHDEGAMDAGAVYVFDLSGASFSPTNPWVDQDFDGAVGFSDLLVLLASWGACPPDELCPADLDSNGSVGFSDLLILLSAWSFCE